MTDPLRPFAHAIRSWWRTRTRNGTDGTSSSAAANTGSAERGARTTRTGETLQSRLRARMHGIETTDARRMRDAFVETVLLWEIGEHLAPDPAFAEVVARVSEQLAADPALGAQLHQVLLNFSERPSAER